MEFLPKGVPTWFALLLLAVQFFKEPFNTVVKHWLDRRQPPPKQETDAAVTHEGPRRRAYGRLVDLLLSPYTAAFLNLLFNVYVLLRLMFEPGLLTKSFIFEVAASFAIIAFELSWISMVWLDRTTERIAKKRSETLNYRIETLFEGLDQAGRNERQFVKVINRLLKNSKSALAAQNELRENVDKLQQGLTEATKKLDEEEARNPRQESAWPSSKRHH